MISAADTDRDMARVASILDTASRLGIAVGTNGATLIISMPLTLPADVRASFAAAVDAYDAANPLTPLPRNAARLLAAMFPVEDVCQRSQTALAGEGFNKNRLPGQLQRLVEAGLPTRHRVAGASIASICRGGCHEAVCQGRRSRLP